MVAAEGEGDVGLGGGEGATSGFVIVLVEGTALVVDEVGAGGEGDNGIDFGIKDITNGLFVA